MTSSSSSKESSIPECDLIGWGMVPTGYLGTIGDPCLYWTGDNIVTGEDVTWPSHEPASYLSTEYPLEDHPVGLFSIGLTFTLPAGVKDMWRISIVFRVDNWVTAVKLNGNTIGSCGGVTCDVEGSCFSVAQMVELTEGLVDGENTLILECENCEGYVGQLSVQGAAAYFVCYGVDAESSSSSSTQGV